MGQWGHILWVGKSLWLLFRKVIKVCEQGGKRERERKGESSLLFVELKLDHCVVLNLDTVTPSSAQSKVAELESVVHCKVSLTRSTLQISKFTGWLLVS